jgi:hypothetical protein
MKTTLILPLMLLALSLTGCGSFTHVVGAPVAGAAGAAIGQSIDPKHGGIIGAAAGPLIFEGALLYQSTLERKAFDRGVTQAQADAVHRYAEMVRSLHNSADLGDEELPISIPAYTTNGVQFVPSTTTLHLSR